MRTYYSADYILPGHTSPLKNGVVAVGDEGEILDIYHTKAILPLDAEVKELSGVITPGFINSHCHLELSHLHQQIPSGKGLINFVKEVISHRKEYDEEMETAMQKADEEMFRNGIVAVGDISNTLHSKNVKLKSPILYHTYIEILGFDPEKAKEVFLNGIRIREEFGPLRSSIVPHAPYSASKELIKMISRICGREGQLMSIHNQESSEENKFFRYKEGEFPELLESLGINIGHFKPQARNSIQSYLPALISGQKILLVHNTYTSVKDVYFVRRSGKDVYWCFCPNANLFIEGKLPKIGQFHLDDGNIVLGTDSLASNKQLSILSEIFTLQENFPELSLTNMIKWATINGARFLGIDDVFGSIEVGKKPGLNLITDVKNLRLSSTSKVVKLI